MNAVLLAAGFGTRLRPLTDHTPKCLVDILGQPLLDYWLNDLDAAGVQRFLLNTHHLADQVGQHASRHRLSARIEVVHEPALLGTAGTLQANESFVRSGPTLVAHADNLCLCDWRAFMEAHHHRPSGCVMTMMTFDATEPEKCGIVELDARGIVQRFHEKVPNPPGRLANAAVYIIEPTVMDVIATAGEKIDDISNQVLPRLLGRIHAWHNADVLIDIGTPERLAGARALMSARQTGEDATLSPRDRI